MTSEMGRHWRARLRLCRCSLPGSRSCARIRPSPSHRVSRRWGRTRWRRRPVERQPPHRRQSPRRAGRGPGLVSAAIVDIEAGPQLLLRMAASYRSDLAAAWTTATVIGDATGLGRGQWDESTLPRSAVAALAWQPPAYARSATADTTSWPRQPRRPAATRAGGESLSGTLVSAPRGGRFAEDVKAGSEFFDLGSARPCRDCSRFPLPKSSPLKSHMWLRLRMLARTSVWLGLTDGSLVKRHRSPSRATW